MILAWLLACSEDPTTADPIDDEPDASETIPDEGDAALDRGEDLYQANCSSCHGARGNGDVELEKVSSDQLVAQILDGSDEVFYGAMPSFAEVLADDEIADVALYVETVLWERDQP